MKRAMSNVDVAAVTEELQALVGAFVGKAYQISSDMIRLTLQAPGLGKAELLMEAGRRVHLTERGREASRTPPQFPVVLRSHLSGGRIASIQQHELDRVMEIAVERAGERRVLIVELFPKGDIALLDGDGRIILPLRPMVGGGRRMLAGEPYVYHEGQTDPRYVSRDCLSKILESTDAELVRALARNLNMGGVYGEEVCLRAEVEKTRPASGLDDEEVERVHAALGEVFQPKEIKPEIVYEGDSPLDVVPSPLMVYEGQRTQQFESLSQALDQFFVEKVEKPKSSPIDRRLEIQRRAIDEFMAIERESVQAGEFIYEHYPQIEALLATLAAAKDKGLSYTEIWERIRGSNLPQAKAISSMDYKGEVHLVLDSQELDISAELSVPQNAQRYYDKAKEMLRKREGAKAALETTLKLKEGGATPARRRSDPQRRRKRKARWYERFRWFNSSDGFLVIGGRDSDGNEEIFAKYLEKMDLALHTDAPGAPLTVIKAEKQEVPESTILEAAQFAVSYSTLWKGGLAAGDCYLVGGDQVTKTPESGEFLRKGAFVIRGERRYLRDVPLGIDVGIADEMLIGGPTSAVRGRADPVIEVEPGEYNADDLAKRIYRAWGEKFKDRRELKALAPVDGIVSFLPPGGSREKG